MTRAVHLGGWGAVTGFGAGRAALLAGIRGGASALLPRRRTAGGPVPTEVAAEVPGLEDCPPAERALRIALDAAREALASTPGGPRAGDTPLVLATTKAELTGVFGETAESGRGLGSPARLAQRLAAELGAPGVVASVSCACASGVVALSLAARRIAAGELERALVVGVDVLDEFVLAGFGGLHALDPGPCRPFDRLRRGVSLGDGAGALLLTARAAEGRGLRAAGWGGANDACHVTGPDREGAGIALAVERALARAGRGPEDVDLVHVHGTGTAANDACEALGLVRAFDGGTPPAFGTKAQTGHTLGAAGVLETCLLADALARGEAPANVGLAEPDVDDRLDLVRAPRRLARARAGLKVSSGFGGIDAALVVAT